MEIKTLVTDKINYKYGSMNRKKWLVPLINNYPLNVEWVGSKFLLRYYVDGMEQHCFFVFYK